MADPDTRHASLFRARVPGATHVRSVVDVVEVGRGEDAEGFGGDFEVGGQGAVDFPVEDDVECLVVWTWRVRTRSVCIPRIGRWIPRTGCRAASSRPGQVFDGDDVEDAVVEVGSAHP